ncbi:MAG: hypothetical protein RR604_08305 [Eubacterium sp.]
MIRKSFTVTFILLVFYFVVTFIMKTNTLGIDIIMILCGISMIFFWIFVSGKANDDE